MLRKILYTILVLALVVVAFTLRTLWLAGVFKNIEPRKFGACHWVKGPVGPEDITIHPKTGIAYISSCDRRAVERGEPRPGAIFAYDLNRADARPVNLTPNADTAFQPHGISLWVGSDGNDVLFIINHQPLADGTRKHSVRLFNLVDGALHEHATVGSPLLVTPNDLVAVGPDHFYLTNTHKNPPGFWQTVETYLRLNGAQVLYFDGQDFKPVIEDVVFPNGINVSRDGRTLYVASTTSRRIYMYNRDPKNERLQRRGEVYLGTGADNIDVDADDTVWVAGHPNLLRVGQHAKNPAQPSPSDVFRILPGGQADEVYADNGDEVSGASVAAVYGKRMLIGQIFDDGFLDCALP